MNGSSNALLRHRTIDACLRDKKNRYTLLDLINACSNAMKEKYGKKLGEKCRVSVRTVQLDLQIMRDKVNGYGAPIIVYNQKYYRYKDPSYSIEGAMARKDSLTAVAGLVEQLKQYTSFNELHSLRNVINILDEEIQAHIADRRSVITYEVKRNSLGLEYFDTIHDAIINRKVLCIGYYSSRSNNIISIIFYPFYMKEYKGRWYALGYKDGLSGIYKLPLDRIRDFSYSILPFPQEYTFYPDEYFRDIIGVTKLTGGPKVIRFLVKNKLAPFIKLNPLHHSQTLQTVHENGDMEFEIIVIPNKEFYNLIFEYQPYISVISPREVGMAANERVMELVEQLPDYSLEKEEEDQHEKPQEEDEFNLFSQL